MEKEHLTMYVDKYKCIKREVWKIEESHRIFTDLWFLCSFQLQLCGRRLQKATTDTETYNIVQNSI